MLTFPILFPRRPRGRAKKSHQTPPLPPGPFVLVTQVIAPPDAPGEVEFHFSLPVTCNGAGSDQIVFETPEGSGFASESVNVAPDAVRFRVTDVTVLAGDSWRIGGVPACLDFSATPEAEMPVPQSGIIE